MNLQDTVSKILGKTVTNEEAKDFADQNFGLLCTYLRSDKCEFSKSLSHNQRAEQIRADLTPCPNMCFNGSVYHYPDPERALHVFVDCEFCKGKGVVTTKEAIAIEKLL